MQKNLVYQPEKVSLSVRNPLYLINVPMNCDKVHCSLSANEHGSQNGEFYFRTVFHFRTNHEAAGSQTGSGAFKHVPLNWFLPENHCFLDVHFLQNCHRRMKKQDGHKTSLVIIIFSLTGPDVQKKMYQMEIQLENMVAHFFGTFPFTQTDLAKN